MTVGAEQGEIAEVGSPVDVASDAGSAGQGALLWTTVTIVVAAALLALFNATTMAAWQDELAPGRASDRLRPVVAGWQGTTARLHLDAPRSRLHDRWNAARAARFGSERPGEPGTE